MILTGLTLSQVLTVLGVAGALVTILYLLKLRRRRVRVPFVNLWNDVLAEKQSTRLFSQLKRWLSLLVALLIVAALAFALGDPRYEGATAAGRNVVLLVDCSASMQATDVEPTRLGRAQELARTFVEELGPADRVLIAQLDATATPLTPLTSNIRLLNDAIDELEGTEVAANLRTGLAVSLDVLRDKPNAEVVLLSDGAVSDVRFDPSVFEARLREADVRFSWVKIGDESENVAITAFSVRRYPLDKSQSEVLVELFNPSEEDQAVELSLLGDGEPVDLQRLNIRGGERIRRFFRNISGVDQTLEARLSASPERDFLEADNRAYARLPERRRARVLVVSEANLYLQAALLLDEYLQVTEVVPSEYTDADDFDAVIFDRWVPPRTPSAPALYLYPQAREGGQGPFEVKGEVEGPYFTHLDRRHPLLKWTALGDVNISSALAVDLEQGDRAIGRSGSDPLIVAGSREGIPFVALTFDPRVSDLPLRVAWPLLLLNTIDYFAEESAGFVSSYHTGETWHVPAADVTRAQVRDPSGTVHEVPVTDGRAVFAGLHTGFYTLVLPNGEEELFAANLGPSDESVITPAEEVRIGELEAKAPTAGKPGLRKELWLYLALFVLLVLVVEWFTYHRRVTV